MKPNLILKLAIMLVLSSFIKKAYGQSYSIGVGEMLTLNVPSVSIGYVDKAIWACSNPAISFVSKSSQYAKITALKSFEGYATVELVYVEKYVDYKGFTRANTYSRNFHVSCKNGMSGGGSSESATSIYVEPEIKVAIGETAKIHYQLYPEGSTAKLWTHRYPDRYFTGLSFDEENKYVKGHARDVGVENVSIYFYNENEEEISATCKVTVYDPTWIEPQSVSLKDALILTVGDNTKKLLPLYTPSSATCLYEWSSDNPSVAYLAWTGCFVAKSVGIANMTLKTSNDLLARCTLVVIPDETLIPGLEMALNRAAEMLRTAEIENVK